MKALVYVEIDVPYCTLSYGVAPCTASIGVTGSDKCFNTRKTCQDATNFSEETITLRFAVATSYLPRDIECIPALKTVSYNPGTISLGENLGQRSTVECSFEDFRHPDTGRGFDKYYSERSYDPFKQGTFWGKFRSRQPYMQGRAMRVIRGFLGQALEEMQTQHFVVEKFNGPTPEGVFVIVGKDVLKLADNDRAQCPRLNNGSLSGSLSSSASSLTLTPAGVGEEYSGDGYINIGGAEVAYYNRPAGVDAKTSLCLQGDGSGTTLTDVSPNALVPQYNNGASISATVIKSGNSILFDGVDDYFYYSAESVFDFGAKDFTVEFQIRPVTLGVRHTVVDFGPEQGTDFSYEPGVHYMAIVVNADNTVSLEINGEAVLTSSSSISAGLTWHIAVTRKNSFLNLYFHGSKEASKWDFSNLKVAENRPVFGTNGADLSEAANYRLDGIRVSKGVARWSVNSYTVPGNFSTSTTAGDTMDLVRGELGTAAVGHSAQDRVQEVTYLVGMDPAYIAYVLLANYANIDPMFMLPETWAEETGAYLQQVYTSYIADPVGVNKLLSELIEQAALVMWWDEISQQVRLQVLREIPASSSVVSPDNRMAGTLSITEQPERRVSQVWTYFGMINPLVSLDEPRSYSGAVATVDLELEALYGSPAIKKIFSRWIAPLGKTVAEKLNTLVLSRFKNPPRLFSFEIMRNSDVTPDLGGTLLVESPFMQDATGLGERAPVQITRLNPASDRYQVECEEILGGAEPGNLLDRVIVVESLTANLNLRTAHDSIYPAIVDPYGITVTFVIDTPAVVYATSMLHTAITVGSWPAGTDISLIIKGKVYGAGGDADGKTLAGSRKPGGDALYTRVPISITLDPGSRLWSGGGGGGRTKTVVTDQETGSVSQVVSPGGGGAGYIVGKKGAAVKTWSYAIATASASNGSLTTGGNRGSHKFTEFAGEFTHGGGGGDIGSAGSNGTDTFGASVFFRGAGNRFRYEVENTGGGSRGAAINGDSYVTLSNSGDLRGSRIN